MAGMKTFANMTGYMVCPIEEVALLLDEAAGNLVKEKMGRYKRALNHRCQHCDRDCSPRNKDGNFLDSVHDRGKGRAYCMEQWLREKVEAGELLTTANGNIEFHFRMVVEMLPSALRGVAGFLCQKGPGEKDWDKKHGCHRKYESGEIDPEWSIERPWRDKSPIIPPTSNR